MRLVFNSMTLNMSSGRIDGDEYYHFSLIGKTDLDCDVYLTWVNTASAITTIKLGEMTSEWGRLETDTLNTFSSWAGKVITGMSLSFRSAHVTGDDPVRIGWVKLENGEL